MQQWEAYILLYACFGVFLTHKITILRGRNMKLQEPAIDSSSVYPLWSFANLSEYK